MWSWARTTNCAQPVKLGGCDHPGHLFDYGDVLLLPLDPGEAIEVVLQGLDLLVQLQLGDDVAQLGLGAAREVAADITG